MINRMENALAKSLIVAVLAVTALPVFAQSPLAESPNHAVVKTPAVQYLFPEQVSLPAGKASSVVLHFRVALGYHVNSHSPKEDYLIPTTLAIPADSGVQLTSATYPPGSDITLPLDPDTKLNVYTGEFAIEARIVAEHGNHLVQATLHYQACDSNACFPPKTITVPVDVIGR
jgi:hypothetical protein